MNTFIFSSLLLVPLMWIVLSGPRPVLFELAGGVLALSWLVAQGQILALLRLTPFLIAGVVYACAGYVATDRPEFVMYSYQMALLIMFYALPAGLCLRRLAYGKQGNQVAWALLLMGLAMTLVSLVILRTPEVQQITGEAFGRFQRTNGDESKAIVYLKYFTITNIIIGVIPFTLFALAALPVALTTRSAALRVFTCAAGGIAIYANVLIATRTAITAAAVSSVAVLLCARRSISKRHWFFFGAALLATAAAGGVYSVENADRFNYLVDRFAEAGSDGRFAIWAEAIHVLEQFPFGHASQRLQTHSWAHNVFIDVGLTYGWIAMAAVLVMFGSTFAHLGKRLRTPGFFHAPVNVIMLGWLLATTIAAMIQPPQPVFITVLNLACAYFAPVRYTSAASTAAKPDDVLWPSGATRASLP